MPGRDERIAYAIHGAVGGLAGRDRARFSAWIDSGGLAPLTETLKACAQGWNLSDDDFAKTFGTDRVGSAALLRFRAVADEAQRMGDVFAATAHLADAVKSLGVERLMTATPALRQRARALFEANADTLANILHAEAGSPPDRPAMEAIGHTLLNRMARNGEARVDHVQGYARTRVKPDAAERAMARALLDGSLPDITGGATNFYSPKSMPKDGESIAGRDTRGGLESVAGVVILGVDQTFKPIQNWKPEWTRSFEPRSVPSVPPSIAKFYRQPGSGHVW